MKEYRVNWSIYIQAESPEEAARWAQLIQRDPSSIATVFEVTDPATGKEVEIDRPPLAIAN